MKNLMFLVLVLAVASLASADVILAEDFESGTAGEDLNKDGWGPQWGGPRPRPSRPPRPPSSLRRWRGRVS